MKKITKISSDEIMAAAAQIRPLLTKAKAMLEQETGRRLTEEQAATILLKGVFTRHEVSHELTVHQVAELVNVGPGKVRSEIRRWTATNGREGLGPVHRYGHRTLRIPTDAVKRWQHNHAA